MKQEMALNDKTLSKKEKKIKKKAEKDKNLKNSYIYGIIFIVFAIISEIANFVRLGLGFLPTNFFVELSIILIFAGFIFLIPSKPAKLILTIALFTIQTGFNIANASLYKVCNDIITLDMVFTLGFETVDVFEFDQLDIPMIIVSLVITALFIATLILARKYAPKFEVKGGRVSRASMFLAILCVFVIGVSSLKLSEMIYFPSGEQVSVVDNNEYYYTSMNNKWETFKKYGFWRYYINNANVFWGYDKTLEEGELKELKAYIEEGKDYKNQNSMYQGVNVSGSLQGDNLVMIMMESIEWFAIDEYNTPNLYNFINNEALKFTGYHSRNKTNISEQISLLGNVANEYSVKVVDNTVGLDSTYSLPNLFKGEGYESVNFFHDYSGRVYDRYTINKSIGFDNVYAMEDWPLGFEPRYFGDFLDDGDYIKEMFDKFMPRDKSFYSFFTTVTTHGPYTKSNERFEHYYQQFDANYENYSVYAKSQGWNAPEQGTYEYKLIREYKSKAMALEHAFVEIMNYLETEVDGKKLKDNTTIVMFADHNAYYTDMTTLVKGIDKYAKDKNQYNVPLIIYNSDFEHAQIDTFCTTYDLFPTICDLYGISYNQSLIHGHSIFSEDIKDSLFVSTMSGMFDENYFAVTLDDIIPASDGEDNQANLGAFKRKINEFFTKQDMIEKYYRINYSKTISK